MKVIGLIVIGFWTLLTKASMSLLLVKFYMHTYVRSETYVITCASSLLRPLPMQVDYVQGQEGVMCTHGQMTCKISYVSIWYRSNMFVQSKVRLLAPL